MKKLIAVNVLLLSFAGGCSVRAPFWGYEIKTEKQPEISCVTAVARKLVPDTYFYSSDQPKQLGLTGKLPGIGVNIDLRLAFSSAPSKGEFRVGVMAARKETNGTGGLNKIEKKEAIELRPQAITSAKDFLSRLEKECGLTYAEENRSVVCNDELCDASVSK